MNSKENNRIWKVIPKYEGRRSAGRLIEEISRMAHTCFQAEFKPYAIGHAQIMTLLYVARNEVISQDALVKHYKLDKSSVTSQLSILERNGDLSKSLWSNPRMNTAGERIWLAG